MAEIIKQISVFLENKPGRLAQVVSGLAKEKLNISAITVAEHKDRSVLRLVTDDMKKTKRILTTLNLPFVEDDVLLVTMRNQPGALANVCEQLAGEHINIDYAYSSATSANGKSLGIFKISNLARGMKMLTDSHVGQRRNGFSKMNRKGRNTKSNQSEE